ncbi:hypothetical protein Bca52824_060645 [Brassica carinata]|uniref:Uncharacterized protein n=1 Tax=Brassica carinata TaxID=52824 RepID=A0A8X7QWV8_BRACI|nr:hypothetical protein Bca52824_060645 [Brassica carinata]
MDPRAPYSQSSSYVGLLNSQNDSVLHSNFPFESFPSSINIGDSEIPPFASQHYDEAPSESQERPRKTGEDASNPSSPNVGDEDIRPEGVKAAKARRNGGKGKAQVDYDRVWEIKREDLAGKERLSKLAILDTLLQRKEPLSEAEEVVKNKLLELLF